MKKIFLSLLILAAPVSAETIRQTVYLRESEGFGCNIPPQPVPRSLEAVGLTLRYGRLLNGKLNNEKIKGFRSGDSIIFNRFFESVVGEVLSETVTLSGGKMELEVISKNNSRYCRYFYK
jgi:hypothetical protein